MYYRPTTLNPAAVLGASLLSFCIETPTQAHLSVARMGSRTDKLEGHFFAADAALFHGVFTDTRLRQFVRGGFGTHRSERFEKLPYDDALQVAAKMHASGFCATDPLLYAQVERALTGRTATEHAQAYQDFELLADRLLAEVGRLNFSELSRTKGIRTTVTPRKARALSAGANGVHVFPDPYDARYVHVQLIGLDETAFRQVRDIAFEVFERVHQRPQVCIL